MWAVSAHRKLFTLTGHTAPISAVKFSLDGQGILTTSEDRTRRLWAASDGRELLALKGHTGLVSRGAFSPDTRILSVTLDPGANAP